MQPEDIQAASFRGVPWIVEETTLTGGRRVVRKTFPNSDLQSIEDLGKAPREFTLRGTVAAQRDASGAIIVSYENIRNALVNALEAFGPGTLVHPFWGRIENAHVVTFNLREATSQLGDSPIDITFAIKNSDSAPIRAESVVGSVRTGTEAVGAAVSVDVADRFEVTPSFSGNFSDAIVKVGSFATKVRTAVNVVTVQVSKLDAFASAVAAYETNTIALVTNAVGLGNDTIALIQDFLTIYEKPQDAYDSLARLFNFGDDDVSILPTTPGKIERIKNRASLNSAVQAVALAEAYLAAAQLTYDTADDVQRVSGELEDQYQKIIAEGDLGTDAEESLSKLRLTTKTFLDQEKDLRPQILTVYTTLTSSRLLAYQYYGRSNLGSEIALLNGANDPTLLEGNVRILST